MARFFNTSGPNNPADHYTLSVLDRLPGVRKLIDQKLYFVLHAPRQVGKTTALLSLAQELTAEGRYTAVLLSMEQGAPFSDDPGAAELAVLGSWRGSAEAWLPAELQPPPWPEAAPGDRIGAALRVWARASLRPLVLFLDEVDALQDETLISVLRQIRAGFPARPEHFPWSLALVGLRDIRDYKVSSSAEGRLGTASELTQGQPWLVNALARQLTEVLVTDPAQAITVDDVNSAKELLIRRQDTHLDSLVDRLREPRVRAILEPMLAGETPGPLPEDDRQFMVDLGLLRRSPFGGLEVANPIYREIIVRTVIFDRRPDAPPLAERLGTANATTPTGRDVTVVRA